MSTEIKMKKKWPYLWYDPQTALPFDFKPDNQPLKSPHATRTSKLREELLKKSSQEPLEPYPRHILTTPTSVSVGTTKTQRLREMLASRVLEEQHRRDSSYKTTFKARSPPTSTREIVILRPHKTTNSQRLREEFSRKSIEKRNEDTIASFLETHRRVMSGNADISPPVSAQKGSEVTSTSSLEHLKTAMSEEKTKPNVRPIRGKSRKSITSLKSQAPLVNKKPNKTNLARERFNSEPKLTQNRKTTTNRLRAPVRNQEGSSATSNAKKPQIQSLVKSDKVNKAVSKNRVNFLKEKMKRLSIEEAKNAKKPSYTEECLKVLNQSRATLEKSENPPEKPDKNFKVILPPSKQRKVPEQYSPSTKIRKMVQDALSTTGDDSSGSES